MNPLRISVAFALVACMAGLVLALPDATMTITTPAPTLIPGSVLIPVSTSGEPCYTEVVEGTIYNVSSDYSSAEEERVMDGEITGLAPQECRWVTTATCSAQASVTVNGPGSPASPPVPPSDYRAAASQQVQADTFDMNQPGNPILQTGSAVPFVVILYPATGTQAATAANNQLNFDKTEDGKPKLRLRVLSRAEVSLDSKRMEVDLRGSAAQGQASWDGEMAAWAIGGDEVIPVIIVQQGVNAKAIWEVN
jgi:hypothetical protein